MVKTSILSPLTFNRILFSALAVVALGVVVNAQTVVRTNGETQPATGSDVSTVQKADGYASGDVISVDGTSATQLAPFATEVSVASGGYNIDTFTVQSATEEKQYIGAPASADSHNYVLSGSASYNLTFNNVEFQNNENRIHNCHGVFLLMDNSSSTLTLNLDNASFKNFKATGDGIRGAIIKTSGNLTIKGENKVSFYGNATGSGGVIFGDSGKTITINCDEMTFDSGECTNAGAIRNQGDLTITGSKVTFSNNKASSNGGSIYATGTVSMKGIGTASDFTFKNNTAGNNGGSIYSNRQVTIDSNTINFSSNTAVNGGGAILLDANYKLTINGKTVTFDSNTVTGNDKIGGAICAKGIVEMIGKEGSEYTFSNNTATKEGGAIQASGSGITINSKTINFLNNQAGAGGAIAYEIKNTNNKVFITGKDVTFEKNSTTSGNGGVIHTQASVELKGSSNDAVFTFSKNSSKGNAGVMVVVGTVDISTGTFKFEKNSANGNTGIAGAIEARNGITFSGDNTSATFTGNIARSGNGNDIYLGKETSTTKSVLTFKDNGKYSFDGGIYLVDNTLSTVINKAQVTIAGRQYKPVNNEGDPANVEDHTNNYQLQTVKISNGGKLTANLDYIDSLTGIFNLGTADTVGTLELNVSGEEPVLLTMSNTFKITGADNGKVVKTGDGTLQILAAEGLVDSHSLVVSSGRLDMKKYFTGSLEVGEETAEGVYSTAIFSPGNSIGELNITGSFTLNPGSTLLLEFDETGVDTLNVSLGTTTFEEGSFVTLTLAEGASFEPNQQISLQLPKGIDTDVVTLSYPSLLLNASYDPGTGILSASVDANAVPEPSTWALLALGAAGLMYWRKRK